MSTQRPDFYDALDPLLNAEFEDSVAPSTLRTRRNLLLACLIGAALTVTGLDVLQVTLAGATASDIEIDKLLSILLFVIAYLQIHFSIYSYSDFQTRKVKLHKRRYATRRAFHEISESSRPELERIQKLPDAVSLLDDPSINSLAAARDSLDLVGQTNRSSSVRLFFDIWVPQFIAFFSIALVASKLAGLDIFYALLLTLGILVAAATVYVAIKRKAILAFVKRLRRKKYRKRVEGIAKELRSKKPEGEELKRLQDKARTSLIKSLGLGEKGDKE